MIVTLLFIAAALLVALGGLMATLDSALTVTSRVDLLEWSKNGRNAVQLHKISEDPEGALNAVIFVRILAETSAAVLVTVAFDELLDNIWWAMLAAAVIMTGVSFVLVGASPRTVGRQHAKGLLRAAAPIVRFVRVLLNPLSGALASLGERVTPGTPRSSSFASEEQLLSIIDEAAENELIEEDDRELIHSVFEFTDRFVRAVMVPRTDMVTVDATATTRDAMQLFLDTGVSRVPVIDGEVDDVVGVLYLKDLVQVAFRDAVGWREAEIRGLLRPAAFVPESMKAESLLQQMKRDAVHVCLVVDEYGGIAGLVTLEDLIEELVGDIADEYDVPSSDVVRLAPDQYRVAARLPLDELGDLFGMELDDEDVDSVGGLFAKVLGRIPQPGAQVRVAGLSMTAGAPRRRGRGIGTVLVERSEGVVAATDALRENRSNPRA